MQLPGGQTPKAAVMTVVANVSNATAQTKSWFSMAKQATTSTRAALISRNRVHAQPCRLLSEFTVAACELRFVQQPPNPWQKSTTTSPAVAAAVYAGSTAVASSGLNPSLGATPTGAPGGFTSGTASYNATTFVWSWPSGTFAAATPSGLYNLVLSASGYTSVKSDSNPAAGDQEAPFRVTDNNCLPGQTCNVTSNLSGSSGAVRCHEHAAGLDRDRLPAWRHGDRVQTGWPNRLSYPDANGNPVYFPAVASTTPGETRCCRSHTGFETQSGF